MAKDQAIDPKIIARIKKLHNMAEGAKAVGSLAEADSFMEAVKKTLLAHNLDMGVLAVDLRDLQDPLGKTAVKGIGNNDKASRHGSARKAVDWVTDLAIHVAEAHYCATTHSTTSSYIWFYGRKNNRETAERMFVYLRDMAERLAWDAYVAEVNRRRKERGSERGAGQWRLNWLEGFVAEVGTRYRAMRKRMDEDRSVALVLVSVKKEAEDAAHEEVGAWWKRVRLPDSEALAGRWAGMTLWEVGAKEHNNQKLQFVVVGTNESEVRNLMAFLRDTKWPDGRGREKLDIIAECKEFIKWMGSDMLEARDYDHEARAKGGAAARNVNLNPNLVEDQATERRHLTRGSE